MSLKGKCGKWFQPFIGSNPCFLESHKLNEVHLYCDGVGVWAERKSKKLSVVESTLLLSNLRCIVAAGSNIYLFIYFLTFFTLNTFVI